MRLTILFLTLTTSICWGVEPYTPQTEASIEDQLRWTELPLLEGFNFRCAVEGPGGEIWLGSNEGVVRYDGKTATAFEINVDDFGVIKDIHATRNGVVIVLTSKGIFRLDEGNWTQMLEEESNIAASTYIVEISDGDLWIGVNSKLIHINGNVVNEHDIDIEEIGSVVIDHNKRIWVACMQTSKLIIFDLPNVKQPNPGEYMAMDLEGVDNFSTKLFVDSSGRVLIIRPDQDDQCFFYEDYTRTEVIKGIQENGIVSFMLSVVEPSPERFIFLTARHLCEFYNGELKAYGIYDFPLPTSYSFMVPLAGNRLLMGGRASKTYIVDLGDSRWITYKYLNFQCEDNEGNYWFIDHDRRIISCNKLGEEWQVYSILDGIIDTPNSIFTSKDGTIWVSGMHEDSAAVSYRQKSTWIRRSFYDVGPTFSHIGVCETNYGSVIFGAGLQQARYGSRAGGGVMFTPSDGEYKSQYIGPPMWPKRVANVVYRENDGFWFGSNGLAHVSGSNIYSPEFIEPFIDRWIDHMIVDKKNRIWIALWGDGIHSYDGKEWSAHDSINGISSEQVVFLLEESESGNILAATAEGLSRFDGESWSKWSLPEVSLFKRENNTLKETSDGSIWLNYAYRSWLLEGIVNPNRRNEFLTRRYRADTAPPDTFITQEDHSYPEGYRVSIDWSGVDGWSNTPSARIEYSWRLNGGDWSPFTREQGTTLENLKGGEHQIEVRARDFDLNVDPSPATTSINIILPVWKRGWFILSVIATFSLIFYLSYALFKIRVKHALAMEQFRLDFFTNISHEIKNPLAAILGPLESVLRTEKKTQTRMNLQIAARNARKLQGLIDQLLQFRKLELGKAVYRPTHGEIAGFVRDSINVDSPLWTSKGQTVHVSTKPQYFECYFDTDKLQKILDNLITNAIKYSPVGGAITVKLEIITMDLRDVALLVVEDNGIGIPQHEIDHVSKPFYRSKKESLSQPGFGIGLAMVYQFVKLWGGEFLIESPINVEPQNGTRVTIHLPLPEPSHEVVSDSSLNNTMIAEENDSGRKGKPVLLIVEDNDDLRLFMKNEFIEKYTIIEAENGLKGYEVAKSSNVDLIITDVIMPEMDGFELCRRIREDSDCCHIPIIILTAKSSSEHQLTGINQGADAFLPKPLDIPRLNARIRQLLQMRAQLKQQFAKKLTVTPKEVTVTSMDEEILSRALEVVESHIRDEHFDVDHFAREMSMGRGTLYRKLKALTGLAPNPFIRSIRLKRAAQLLKTQKVSVAEAMEHVGIMDSSYFSRIFKKEFGMSPTTYMNSGKDNDESA